MIDISSRRGSASAKDRVEWGFISWKKAVLLGGVAVMGVARTIMMSAG